VQQATATVLNQYLNQNLSSSEWGRKLEALKAREIIIMGKYGQMEITLIT
jgi:hypothetical protein